MNRMRMNLRTGAVNGAALMFLIMLVILTIIFGILAYLAVEDERAQYQGTDDPKGPSAAKSLTGLVNSNKTLATNIEAIDASIAEHEARLNQLDIELLALGTMHNERHEFAWIGRSDEAGDKGPWRLTRIVLEQRRDRLRAWKDHHEALHNTGYPDIDAVTAQFRSENRAVLAKSAEIDDKLQDDRADLEQKIDAYGEEKDKEEAAHRIAVSSRKSTKSKLDAEIRELLELRLEHLTDIETDGGILRSDLEGDYVLIDRGASNGIFNGLKFEVFNYVRGQIFSKGMIEVTKVEQHSATCRVIHQVDLRRNPIVRGDRIGNPVFDPLQPKIFYLAGEFSIYNRSDLAQFIKDTGGIVKTELVPGIDFLVAGARSEKLLDKAREYQVTVMTEAQLVKYLTPHFRPMNAGQ